MTSRMPVTVLDRDEADPRPQGGAQKALPMLGPDHLDAIEQSHERCARYGLAGGEAGDYSQLGRGDMSEARERNRRLHLHAAPVMEMLFEQIVDTQSMVLLTDACGTILHSISDDGLRRAHARKVALRRASTGPSTRRAPTPSAPPSSSEAPTTGPRRRALPARQPLPDLLRRRRSSTRAAASSACST